MDLNNPQDNWEECIQNYAREIVNPDLKLDISRIYNTIRDREEYFPDKQIDQYFRLLLDSLSDNKKARKCFKSIFGNHSFRYMDSKSLNPIAKADAFKMDLCILFRAFPRWFARASLFLLQNGSTIRVVLKALTVNSSDELDYDVRVQDLDFTLPTNSEQETVMANYPEVIVRHSVALSIRADSERVQAERVTDAQLAENLRIELPRGSGVGAKRSFIGGESPPPKKQAVASEQPAVSSSSSSVPDLYTRRNDPCTKPAKSKEISWLERVRASRAPFNKRSPSPTDPDKQANAARLVSDLLLSSLFGPKAEAGQPGGSSKASKISDKTSKSVRKRSPSDSLRPRKRKRTV
eukprot:123880_1